MIITYPIQVQYTKGSEQRVVPDSIFSSCEILSGCFPVGKNRFWHGGVHLHPSDRMAPIRAIADGELVAYRYDETDATDAYFDKVPYSRSFVLLKHRTELGQTSIGTASHTFYSLYMHLQAWDKVKGKTGESRVTFLRKLGKKGQLESVPPETDGACHVGTSHPCVQRGDILGYCGSIPDNMEKPSQGIHFEIFFDDVSFLENKLKTVWGTCTLSKALDVLLELTSRETNVVDTAKPLLLADDGGQGGFKKITVGQRRYWVSDEQITVSEVEVRDPRNKKQTIKQTQYFANKNELVCYKKDPVKNQKTLPAGTVIIPWLDPWMNAGEFREEKFEEKTWVQVFVPATNDLYWADKSVIRYTSDADWAKFRKVEERGAFSEDGFIDDVGMQKLTDAHDKNRDESNQAAMSGTTDQLRHLIVRHPTEWSNQGIAKRFGRVMGNDFGPAKLTSEQFAKLTAHIKRLAFWEDVDGLPDSTALWHAHPIKFIEQLAKCLWLSKDEFKLIYPAVEDPRRPTSHCTTDEVREKYRADINKCCYRYGINSRLRQAHFFGQGAIESSCLNQMLETSSGRQYEGNRELGNIKPEDGERFKGRGFKQLTGRYNYAEYWCFKGWLKKGIDFDIGWELDLTKRYPHVNNPEKLIETTFNSIDAGCWYIAFFRNATLTVMDLDDSKRVTKIINGGYNMLTLRSKFTEIIGKTLL